MASIVSREPRRVMMMAPRIAPTTPPRLNAASPLLATPTSNPARVSSVGTQLVPIYTESRQKKKDPHSASLSPRNLGQEKIARGHTPGDLLRAIHERGIPVHVVAQPAQERCQLGPPLTAPRQ